MGRPKLLLPWGTTSILGHLLGVWRGVGAWRIAIVYAADDRAIPGEVDRLGYPGVTLVRNPAPSDGMFSSVMCGARWAERETELTHCVVALGDQPHVRQSTLRSLMEFASQHAQEVCQPKIGGSRTHPVVLPKPVLSDLTRTKEATLQKFLAGYRRAEWSATDPGLELDIDRPEDYERALVLAREEPITDHRLA